MVFLDEKEMIFELIFVLLTLTTTTVAFENENQIPTSYFMQNHNLVEDWSIKKLIEVIIQPIVDKRSDNFKSIREKIQRFTLEKSITFTVYEPETLHFHWSSDGHVTKHFTAGNKKGWVNYLIMQKNQTLFILENGECIYETKIYNGFYKYHKLSVISNKILTWKIQKYNLTVADHISIREPTILKLPACADFYLAQCEMCYFELYVNSEKVAFDVKKTRMFVPHWEHIKISNKSCEEVEVKMFRKKYDAYKEGFWAFDVVPCPAESHDCGSSSHMIIMATITIFIAAATCSCCFIFRKTKTSHEQTGNREEIGHDTDGESTSFLPVNTAKEGFMSKCKNLFRNGDSH